MEISTFAFDSEKESKGTWVDCGNGFRLLLGRMGGKRYEAEVLRQAKPMRMKIRNNEGELLKAANKAIAKVVLLGWEGLEDNGVAIPYSLAKAEELLDNFSGFRELVVSLASDDDLFRLEVEEEEAKEEDRKN